MKTGEAVGSTPHAISNAAIEGTLKQELGILPDGQSVHIGNAIIAEFVITLKKLPIAQRPDVIAQSWYAARLNAAQDNLFSMIPILLVFISIIIHKRTVIATARLKYIIQANLTAHIVYR